MAPSFSGPFNPEVTHFQRFLTGQLSQEAYFGLRHQDEAWALSEIKTADPSPTPQVQIALHTFMTLSDRRTVWLGIHLDTGGKRYDNFRSCPIEYHNKDQSRRGGPSITGLKNTKRVLDRLVRDLMRNGVYPHPFITVSCSLAQLSSMSTEAHTITLPNVHSDTRNGPMRPYCFLPPDEAFSLILGGTVDTLLGLEAGSEIRTAVEAALSELKQGEGSEIPWDQPMLHQSWWRQVVEENLAEFIRPVLDKHCAKQASAALSVSALRSHVVDKFLQAWDGYRFATLQHIEWPDMQLMGIPEQAYGQLQELLRGRLVGVGMDYSLGQLDLGNEGLSGLPAWQDEPLRACELG